MIGICSRGEAAAGLAEYEVLADIAAELDAGVRARDVEEPLSIHAADLHVLDKSASNFQISYVFLSRNSSQFTDIGKLLPGA
jgi:hypothetical protein